MVAIRKKMLSAYTPEEIIRKSHVFQFLQLRPTVSPSPLIYILVHPYFGPPGNPPYLERLKSLVSTASQPILTLESSVRLATNLCDVRLEFIPSTVLSFYSLNPQGPRYFIPNGAVTAQPYCGWEVFAEFVTLFNPETVLIGGSNLMGGRDGSRYWQCVGEVYENLKLRFSSCSIDESISNRIDAP